MITDKARRIIETIKQAFDIFNEMELPVEEQRCELNRDEALALVDEFERITRGRDAAIWDLKYAGSANGEFCSICKYNEPEECEKRKFYCEDCWEWCGVREE